MNWKALRFVSRSRIEWFIHVQHGAWGKIGLSHSSLSLSLSSALAAMGTFKVIFWSEKCCAQNWQFSNTAHGEKQHSRESPAMNSSVGCARSCSVWNEFAVSRCKLCVWVTFWVAHGHNFDLLLRWVCDQRARCSSCITRRARARERRPRGGNTPKLFFFSIKIYKPQSQQSKQRVARSLKNDFLMRSLAGLTW